MNSIIATNDASAEATAGGEPSEEASAIQGKLLNFPSEERSDCLESRQRILILRTVTIGERIEIVSLTEMRALK